MAKNATWTAAGNVVFGLYPPTRAEVLVAARALAERACTLGTRAWLKEVVWLSQCVIVAVQSAGDAGAFRFQPCSLAVPRPSNFHKRPAERKENRHRDFRCTVRAGSGIGAESAGRPA